METTEMERQYVLLLKDIENYKVACRQPWKNKGELKKRLAQLQKKRAIMFNELRKRWIANGELMTL